MTAVKFLPLLQLIQHTKIAAKGCHRTLPYHQPHIFFTADTVLGHRNTNTLQTADTFSTHKIIAKILGTVDDIWTVQSLKLWCFLKETLSFYFISGTQWSRHCLISSIILRGKLKRYFWRPPPSRNKSDSFKLRTSISK